MWHRRVLMDIALNVLVIRKGQGFMTLKYKGMLKTTLTGGNGYGLPHMFIERIKEC